MAGKKSTAISSWCRVGLLIVFVFVLRSDMCDVRVCLVPVGLCVPVCAVCGGCSLRWGGGW